MSRLQRYQQDAYLTELVTTIKTSARIQEGDEGERWLVTLDETIFYATAGGQPHDLGSLGGARVLDVSWRDGEVAHTIDRELAAGARVRAQLDWARRFDHMQQHSAQHLITAICADERGWQTASFHLGESYCAIELDVDTLDDADLDYVERRANEEILADHTITWQEVTVEGYARLDGVRSRGLPDGHVGDVRLVRIAGLDLNTCGGTHVRSTAQLQVIKVIGTERMRGRVRLHFLAGGRVLSALQGAMSIQRALGREFSCAPDGLLESARKLRAELKVTSRRARVASAELASLLGEQLARSEERVEVLYREDADMGFLNAVAERALRDRDDLLILAMGGPAGGGVFLLAGPPEATSGLGPEVALALGGRGGGRSGRYQGRAARLGEAARRAAEAALHLAEG